MEARAIIGDSGAYSTTYMIAVIGGLIQKLRDNYSEIQSSQILEVARLLEHDAEELLHLSRILRERLSEAQGLSDALEEEEEEKLDALQEDDEAKECTVNNDCIDRVCKYSLDDLDPETGVCYKNECLSRIFLEKSLESGILTAVSDWKSMEKNSTLIVIDFKKRPSLQIEFPYTSFSPISESGYDQTLAAIANASRILQKYMEFYVRLNRYVYILSKKKKTIRLEDDPAQAIEHLVSQSSFEMFHGAAAASIKMQFRRSQSFINPLNLVFTVGFKYRFDKEFCFELLDAPFPERMTAVLCDRLPIEVFLKLSEPGTLHTFHDGKHAYIVLRKSFVTEFRFANEPSIDSFSLTVSRLEKYTGANVQRFETDERVMARAADGVQNPFYPGTIYRVLAGDDGSFRYTIVFDDGDVRTVFQSSVVHMTY